MAQTPEGKVKDEIKAELEMWNINPATETTPGNGWYFMPVPTGYGVRGIPDFVGHYRGVFFAIEAKVEGGKPKPWQDRQLKMIVGAEGVGIVATCGRHVRTMLQDITNAL